MSVGVAGRRDAASDEAGGRREQVADEANSGSIEPR